MGIEMVARLVDIESFKHLMTLDTDDLATGLQDGTLQRPPADVKLQRVFDIDASAEILDWLDVTETDGCIKDMALDDACQGLLLLSEWCSVGEWEAWEPRTFIYIETMLGRRVPTVEGLYAEEVWSEMSRKVSEVTEVEFRESVIMDWMERREELKETLDEKRDPHILPTMEAHARNAEGLHHVLFRSSEQGLMLLVGKEHLNPRNWGAGSSNLEHIADHGL